MARSKDKKLSKLSRVELLELLVEQGEQLARVQAELEVMENRAACQEKIARLAENAVSRLAGVLEAAQLVQTQYTQSLQELKAQMGVTNEQANEEQLAQAEQPYSAPMMPQPEQPYEQPAFPQPEQPHEQPAFPQPEYAPVADPSMQPVQDGSFAANAPVQEQPYIPEQPYPQPAVPQVEQSFEQHAAPQVEQAYEQPVVP